MALDSAPRPESPDLGFDPDALREKYRRERDKRLRTDGNAQYLEITGDFGRYLDDPHVEPGFTRKALTDEVDVAIIGGGFSGLLAGARLCEAGAGSLGAGLWDPCPQSFSVIRGSASCGYVRLRWDHPARAQAALPGWYLLDGSPTVGCPRRPAADAVMHPAALPGGQPTGSIDP